MTKPSPTAPHFVLEAYPAAIQKSLDSHEAAFEAASSKLSRGFASIIVKRQHHWLPGSTVRVAFNGGNPALYAKIEQVAKSWTGTGLANLTLQFRDAAGQFNHWTPADTDYAGDIRIGFNGQASGDYWSLVGLDSRDATIMGGGPGQQSMNFQGFDVTLPADWQAVVLHEFGHALGFEHEHQSPAADCGFRFDDDPGYVRTTDRYGWYTLDGRGRRPGLYTYLGGKANYWSHDKVDFNLRRLPPSSLYEVGPYDRLSIMEYVFDPFMFAKGRGSPCFVDHENAALSKQDRIAVAEAYPSSEPSEQKAGAVIQGDTIALGKVKGVSAVFKTSIANRRAYQANAF